MGTFDEMEKYRTGVSEEGHDMFSIPMKADEDGMVGRECPNDECQPKYFKISLSLPDANEDTDFSQAELICPYCGTIENMQEFITKDQRDWIESMLYRGVAKKFDEMMKGIFKNQPSSSGGFISFKMSYKSGSLPSVRHYAENKLKKIVICDSCGYHYAVYGVSYHCPLCKKGNLRLHLSRSIDMIKILLEESINIGQSKGSEIEQQMIGNALEDAVTLFESFLKHIYIYWVRHKYDSTEAKVKCDRIGTIFQRIEGAESIFQNELNFKLFECVLPEDLRFFRNQFMKRHLLTHNLGLIDDKYLDKTQSNELRGKEIEISSADILKTLVIIESVVESRLIFSEIV